MAFGGVGDAQEGLKGMRGVNSVGVERGVGGLVE